MTTPPASEVWRLYETDGVPASGPHKPVKTEVQAWAESLEGEVADALSDVAAALTAVGLVAPLPNGLIVGQIPKTATVTITIATPGVVSWTAHGLLSCSPIVFSTTGALPTGLTAGTIYYVCAGASLQTDSFRVATSIVNAIAGTAVNTSGSQSGTHTALANGEYPYPYKGHVRRGFRQFADRINVPDGTDTVFNSLSLDPGIWLCVGQAGLYGGSGVVLTHMHTDHGLGITNILTVPGDGGGMAFHINSNNSNGFEFPTGMRIYVVTSTSTVNQVMQPDFQDGANSATAYGSLTAWLL